VAERLCRGAGRQLIHDNRCYFAYPYTLTPRIAVISQKQHCPDLKIYADGLCRKQWQAGYYRPEQLSSQALKDYNLVLVFDPALR
jgi:hypothetical protein